MPRNPPPVHSRFKKGQTGNPGGKTSEQRLAEVENARIATNIRGKLLRAVENVLENEDDILATVLRVNADILRLLKDSEDRGLGTPKASVDINNPDGNLKPEPVGDMVQELLKAIHAKPDAG